MRKALVLSLGVGLIAAGCSDTAGPEGDRLSRAEALHLATLVMLTSEGAATASMTPPAASKTAMAGGPPVDFTHTIESTHPCPSGGSLEVDATISGTWDEDTNSLQADLAGRHTHDSCAVPHNNLTITVDGAPWIDFGISIGGVEGQPSQPFTFSLDGGFSWGASDGRSGVCELTLDAVTDFVEQERTILGSICGHTFSQTTTWDL